MVQTILALSVYGGLLGTATSRLDSGKHRSGFMQVAETACFFIKRRDISAACAVPWKQNRKLDTK